MPNLTTSIKILTDVYRIKLNINLYGHFERKYSIYKFTNHFNDFKISA